MKKREFTVVISKDEDGVFIVRCPALPGCHTYGHTKREALSNIREAVELYLEALRELGEPVPEEIDKVTLKVAG